jgi:hypothetical protein
MDESKWWPMHAHIPRVWKVRVEEASDAAYLSLSQWVRQAVQEKLEREGK